MYRVLIADDEMIERKVLYKTLVKYLGDQCEIYQAENGREALQIYAEKKIQIMILDIEMPGISGIEAAEQIREKDKDCCIIFLTAYDEFAYAKKAVHVRALDYLLKPYEEKELLQIMDEAMRLTEESMKKESTDEPEKKGDEVVPEIAEQVPEISYMEDMTELENTSIRQMKVKKKIIDYVQEHYMHELSMQDVARVMNYSEAYFCKLFKQCFNQNFTSYLTEYRMEQAKRMLQEPTVNIKEVGKAVGYSDANYFAKVFKRATGHSPTEYRMGHLKK
ncbi:MAG: response regulator [Brotaphodocola sp.]